MLSFIFLFFTQCKSISLSQHIRHKIIVAIYTINFHMIILWFTITNEFNWGYSSLMKWLEKWVLRICPWFSKDKLSDILIWFQKLFCLNIVTFTYAFHFHLLNMSREFVKCFRIRNDYFSVEFLSVIVIRINQTQKNRDIGLNRIGLEKLIIHHIHSVQELIKNFIWKSQWNRQSPNSRRNTESSSNLIPHWIDVLFIDSKLIT